MTKVTSENKSIIDSHSNKQIAHSFSLVDNPTTPLNITDEFLTNEAVLLSRGKSELLKNGYVTEKITLSTYYIDDIYVSDIMSVDDKVYRIVELKTVKNGIKLTLTITGERYMR
jgi:hypothetical protein